MAKLTTRQKQSRKVSRNKQQKKRLHTLKMRLILSSVLLLVFGIGGGGWWLHQSGWVEQTLYDTKQSFYQSSKNAGLQLNNLFVKGRERTDKNLLINTLNIEIGMPLLAVSLDDLKARMETISTIKEAHIERIMPDTLHIELIERSPIAVWQETPQTLHVIDRDGTILKEEDPNHYPHLLVIVGKGAPEHLDILLELFETNNELANDIVAAVRVGNRRWNLAFADGITAMLPEENSEEAWQKLAKMQHEQGILQKSIQTIDMRLEERIFIKLEPHETPLQKPDYKNARDT